MSIHFFRNTRGVMLTICVMLYLMHFLANSCHILGATSFLLFRVGYECMSDVRESC